MGNLGNNSLTAVVTLLGCPFYMLTVVYCRVSTKEQAKNYSLDSQEKSCREYAKRNGHEIAQVFIDKGESAKTADRPEFLKMIEYCRRNKGKIQLLIVYKLDRFSRNEEDHQAVRAILRRYGVRLVSATENFDESSSGHLMENVTSAFAQFDNEVRAERSKTGLRARFEKGLWPWGAPLGYKNTKTPDGQKIIATDPETAGHITYAFTEFAKGIYSKAEMTRKLRRRGLRTKTGLKLWPQYVGKLLKNKVYAGYVVSKKWKLEKQGSHTALIDLETFYKVQMILQGKVYLAVPHIKCRQEYPLRAFVKCKRCNHPLTASQSRGHGGLYHYYHCYEKPRHGPSYPKSTIETEFASHLERVIPKEARMKLFREVVVDVWETKRKEAGFDSNRIESEIARLDEKRRRTIDLLRSEVLNQEEGRSELTEIREQREQLIVQKSEAADDQFNVRTASDKCVAALKKSRDFWLNLKTVEQKQRFQKLVFPDGLVYRNPGFRTSQMGLLFELARANPAKKSSLVLSGRLELPRPNGHSSSSYCVCQFRHESLSFDDFFYFLSYFTRFTKEILWSHC